jgi:hypothetical protein
MAEQNAAMVLLSGLPGAGKTTFARGLCAQMQAAHLESDAIRRKLFPAPAYTPPEHARVFATLDRMAEAALKRGRPVIIDATNLTPGDRQRFFRIAARYGAPTVAVRMTAPYETLSARLAGPREGLSQATVAILDEMRAKPRPFSLPCVVVDTRFDTAPAIDLVVRLVQVEEP